MYRALPPLPQLAADLGDLRFQGQAGLPEDVHAPVVSSPEQVESGIGERSIMRTRLTIMATILVAAGAAIGVIVLLVGTLGRLGLAIGAPGV